MINKKSGALAVLAAAGLLVLGACGGTGGETSANGDSSGGGSTTAYDLTIWCPSGYNDTVNQIIANFKADNAEYANSNIGITGNIADGEVGAQLAADYTACADILFMADDNLRAGAEANALIPMGDDVIEAIEEQSGEAGLESVTLSVYIENPAAGEENIQTNVYGIPYRNDNGYVLIYDSAKISEDELTSLESILDVCTTRNLDFWYNITDSWYTPSFFWAAGGYFNPTMNDQGELEIVSNFGTQAVADGAQAISDLYKQYGILNAAGGDGWVPSVEAADVEAGFIAGTTAACIMWNDMTAIKEAVGADRADDIKATILPTVSINGEDCPLNTFLGYKVVGVNSNVLNYNDNYARYYLAMEFAQYVTNTASQKLFLDNNGFGPSDMSLFGDENVASNDFLNALNTMSAAGNTAAQGANVTDDFWVPVQDFGAYIRDWAQSENQWGTYSSALDAIRSIILSADGWVDAD